MLEIAANENAQVALALAWASWADEEENDRQKAIVRARKYFDGEQYAYLSARLREILDLSGAPDPNQLLHLNISDKVVYALTDRMHVDSFVSGDESLGTLAGEWWAANRLDAKESSVYENTLRDGESFVFVDLDSSGLPRFNPHPRFCDATNDGSGFGCKAFYPNDDETQPMLYVAKRWTETVIGKNGMTTARQRMTLYYPDHFERYVLDRGKWTPVRDNVQIIDDIGVLGFIPELVDARGFVPWVDGAGAPLGIPIIHFCNRGRKCEIDSTVVSMQNVINHALVDLVESNDTHGFPIWKFFGFYPTSDGKDLKSDGSNRLKLKPNTIIGTTKSRTEVDALREPPIDPAPLVSVIDKTIAWIAQAKDIPTARFQLNAQIPAEGTQKQLEAPMLARIGAIQTMFGNSWEDCFAMARRLVNVFGAGGLDENETLETQWQPLTTRADDRENPVPFWTAAAQAVTAGLPLETYLARNGWSDEDIGTIYESMPNEQLVIPT